MRLLITVVCCLIAIHGSTSVPGSGRKQDKRLFLDQAHAQGLSLEHQVFIDDDLLISDNETKEESRVANINIKTTIQNSDYDSVSKDRGIGNSNSKVIKSKVNNCENLNRNTDNSLTENSNKELIANSLNSVPGINEVRSRSKREVAKSKKSVKIYRYESQPRRSRFSYIQKIQKLFEPKQELTHKILNKHKTIVVENHTAHEEHHSEEIQEHHTKTTSQLKVTKKKRKSKRKPGSPDLSNSAEDYEDEKSFEEEVAETEDLATKNESSNVTEGKSKTKTNTLKSTKVVEPNVSVIAIRNETQNSLEKKETKTKVNEITSNDNTVSNKINNVLNREVNILNQVSAKNLHSVGVEIEKRAHSISQSSNIDLVTKEKGNAVDDPASEVIPIVVDGLKSNTPNENLLNPSTSAVQNGKQLLSQTISSNGRNLKSLIKNVFGLRRNVSSERTIAEVENLQTVFTGSSSAKNSLNVKDNLLDNQDTDINTKTDNRESVSKVSNAAKTLMPLVNQEVTGPTKPSNTQVTKFGIPNIKTTLSNIDLNESEEKNTEINHNVKIDSSKTVSEVLGSIPSVQNIISLSPNLPAHDPKSLITTTKRPEDASLQPSVMREPEPVRDLSTNLEETRNNLVPKSPRIVLNGQGLAPSQPLLIGGNVPSVPFEQNLSEKVTTPRPSKTKIPKFRRPKSKIIIKETSHHTDIFESEEENVEREENVEIGNNRTVFNISNTSSVQNVTNVPAIVPTVTKSKITILNSPMISSSQPPNMKVSKFRRPKNKTISKLNEILSDTDLVESEEEITEKVGNFKIHNHETVPKMTGNVPSIPIVPIVSANIPTTPSSTTRNSPIIPSTQSPKTRNPKFGIPKNKITTTTKEILYDTDVIKSEEENTEINYNGEINKSGTVFNTQKMGENLTSASKLPNTPNVPEITLNSPISQSSKSPMRRVPKFRRPKFKINTATKETIHDTDIIESKEDNIELKRNTYNRGSVFNVTNTAESLQSVLKVPNIHVNTPNVTKSSVKILNAPTVSSPQPNKVIMPTYRRPKSKTINTSKEVSYDVDSKVDKVEINKNFEVDNKKTVNMVPEVLESRPSVSIVPNAPSNVPTISKSMMTPNSKPSVTRVPTFWRPLGKTITKLKETLYNTDIIESEENNRELNNDFEIDTNNYLTKVPEGHENLPSVSILPNIPKDVPTVSKSTKKTTNRPGIASTQLSDIREPKAEAGISAGLTAGGKDTDVSRSLWVTADQQAPLQVSLTRVPKSRRPESKDDLQSTEIVNDNEDLNIEINGSVIKENIIHHAQEFKNKGNIPTIQEAEGKIPAVSRSLEMADQPDSSQPSLKGVPALRRPKIKADSKSSYIIDNKEELREETYTQENEESLVNSALESEIIENIHTSPKLTNEAGNNPSTPESPLITIQSDDSSSKLSLTKVTSSERQKIKELKPSNKLPGADVIDLEKEVNLPILNKELTTIVNNLPALPIMPKAVEHLSGVQAQLEPTGNLSDVLSKSSMTRDTDIGRLNEKTDIVSREESSDKDDVNLNITKTEVNNDGENNKNEAFNTVMGNPSSVINVPKLSSFIPDLLQSLTNIRNRPAIASSQPSLTQRNPEIGPVSTTIDTVDENDRIRWERYSSEINEGDDKYLSRITAMGNLPSVPKAHATADDHASLPRDNHEINVHTEPSMSRIPIFQTSETAPISTDLDNGEAMPNDFKKTVFNLPKLVGNLPFVTKSSTVADNLPKVNSLPKAFGNWPFFSPSQESPIGISKHSRPKTESITTSMVESNDKKNAEEENSEIKDENERENNTETTFKVLKPLKNVPSFSNLLNLPAVPSFPMIFKNEPVDSPSQPSVAKISRPQKSKTKDEPKSIDFESFSSEINNNNFNNKNFSKSKAIGKQLFIPKVLTGSEDFRTVTSSPMKSGVSPYLGPSPISSIKTPKLRRPKSKSDVLTISESEVTDKDNLEEDNKELSNELDINIKTNFNDTKVLSYLPIIPKVPKVAGNLPSIPRVYENEAIDIPSRPLTKTQKSITEGKPTSIDSERYSPEINDNSETFFDKSKEINNQKSVSKFSFTGDNPPDVTNLPMKFEFSPFFAPSQKSSIRAPKLGEPETKPVLSPIVESTDTDNVNSEVDNKEFSDVIVNNTETDFKDTKALNNLPIIPNLPKVAENLPTIPSLHRISENEPIYSPTKTLFRNEPTSMDSERNSPKINPDGFSKHLEAISSQPSVPMFPTVADNPLNVTRLPTSNGGNPEDNESTDETVFIGGNLPAVLKTPVEADNNEELNSKKHYLEENDGTNILFNLPQSDKTATLSRSPEMQENRPGIAPTQLLKPEATKLRRPKNKPIQLFQDIRGYNEDLESESYSQDVNKETKRFFNIPKSEKISGVPKTPLRQRDRPVIVPSQPSVIRLPKLKKPKHTTAQPYMEMSHEIDELTSEVGYTNIKHDSEIDESWRFHDFPKLDGNIHFNPKKPTVSGKLSTIINNPHDPSQLLMRLDTKLKRPKYMNGPNIDDDVNLNVERHALEVDDGIYTSFGSQSADSKLSKLAGKFPYISRTTSPFRNWPVISSPQVSLTTFSKLRRPKIITGKSTGTYYQGTSASKLFKIPAKAGRFPSSPESLVLKDNLHIVPQSPFVIYNQPLFAATPPRLAKLPNFNRIKSRVPISTGFPYEKVVANSKIYNTNIISQVPSVLGHVQPILKVTKRLYNQRTPNIPVVVGNLIPAPKVSLIPGIRRPPMVIEDHPHLMFTSPAYTAMKLPTVRKSKNWMVPSVSGNREYYNAYLNKFSSVSKKDVKNPRELLPLSPDLNFPKARSDLSKNNLFPSSKKHAGILDMEEFNTGLTDTVHLQTDEHETVDVVALKKRDSKTIWGIPISNAAGKIEYLTVGNREGDINFIISTDSTGRVEYLYPIRDDTGRYHNLHLKTVEGHLSLVESDYHGGQHSTGFIGYDETGEYIVPIHFEENHRLVVDAYAHSLRYAEEVHPAYEIATEVFYYKK